MGQVSASLRKVHGGLAHWCPGCEEIHRLPLGRGWTFDGNLDAPTFSPSFKHEGFSKAGVERCCHYILTAGRLNYCGDCTHALAGQTIDLPPLPAGLTDDLQPPSA